MPFDPNPTGDLKQDLNFQELARGLDQAFEGGVTINGLAVDVDFLVKALGGIVGLFVDGTNGRVGIGTATPGAALHVLANSAAEQTMALFQNAGGALQYRLISSGRAWALRLGIDNHFRLRDVTGATEPFFLEAGAPTNSLKIWAAGYLTLGPGAPRFIGRTATAADPTTTELPTDKDFGLHKNTSSGAVFLAYNDGGAIKKVALT